ncbi:hypothetical protein V5799_009091, partial [Amblyomma americanum]
MTFKILERASRRDWDPAVLGTLWPARSTARCLAADNLSPMMRAMFTKSVEFVKASTTPIGGSNSHVIYELSEEQFKALYVLEMLRPVCVVQGQYHRVADDIRRHVAASEKKVKHRPHVAPSLAAEEGAKASEVPPLALSPGLERQAASLSPAISLASPGPSSPLRALSPGGRLSPVTPGSPMRGTASPPLGKLTPVRSMSALGTKSPAA